MKKTRRNILIIIGLLILIGLTSLVGFFLLRDKEDDTNLNTVQLVDEIKGYDYHLKDRDTKLYKEEFIKLKALLEEEDIDYESYAELLGKLYVIDLYTINNKINKYDVGGSQFVYPSAKENYELNVRETIYRYVEDNSNSKRTQKLPEVSSITVSDIKETKYTLEETEYEGYEVSIDLQYIEDLGYDEEVSITLIKDENKLYVVEHK